MNEKDMFKPDLSRAAVFSPGSVKPFGYWDTSLIDRFNRHDISLTSWWASNLCHLSYCNEDEIGAVLRDRGDLMHIFKAGAQLAFAVRIKDTVFIVFQGSTSGEDAILDLKFFPKKDNGIYLHRGFKYALDMIWPQLIEFINKHKDLPIYFTGHSLGGAMAQIASFRTDVEGVYTFGAPRVSIGNPALPISEKTYRTVNCSDGAVWLPPALFGFRHSGNLIFIDSSQEVHFESSVLFRAGERLKYSLSYALSFNSFKKGNAFMRSLVDHAPVNYCRALSRHLVSKST